MKVEMTTGTVNTAILINRGRAKFSSVTWKSEPRPAAAHKARKLEKLTCATVRAGVDFSNKASVKAGIESGERGEVQPLPWGEWLVFPYIITHKGARYIRLESAPNHRAKSIYFVDGAEVSKNEFASFLTPSDAKKLFESKEDFTFTIKEENLLSVAEVYLVE